MLTAKELIDNKKAIVLGIALMLGHMHSQHGFR